MKDITGCGDANWARDLWQNDILEDDEEEGGGVRVAVREEEAIVELCFEGSAFGVSEIAIDKERLYAPRRKLDVTAK